MKKSNMIAILFALVGLGLMILTIEWEINPVHATSATPAVLLEDIGASEGLKRSWELTAPDAIEAIAAGLSEDRSEVPVNDSIESTFNAEAPPVLL